MQLELVPMIPGPGQHEPSRGSGRRGKVVLAMSGGVDSSAAARLLLDDGFEVVGVFMRNGAVAEPEPGDACDPGGGSRRQGCCSVNDAHDARLVAGSLGIPLYVLNFEKDFGRIMDYFAAEYNAGRTPNPCVRCNDWLKFGRLHDYARSIDADFVASGHYAQVVGSGTGRRLLRGVDRGKDQSYVLFGAPRARLARMLLPVGGYEKPVIRQIAADAGLVTFDKPDSQEICFVPDNDYAGMVQRRTQGGFAEGPILDVDGNTVGRHGGHQRFTLGQRRGLGLAMGYPVYVVGKDAVANTVTVGRREDLLVGACSAGEANWLVDAPPPGRWQRCLAKVRYNSEPVAAQVAVSEACAASIEVRFREPVDAVTPGQAVVCYGTEDGDLADAVLCGGWIDAAW